MTDNQAMAQNTPNITPTPYVYSLPVKSTTALLGFTLLLRLRTSLPPNVLGRILAPSIIPKQLLVPLAAHLHELARIAIVIGPCLPLVVHGVLGVHLDVGLPHARGHAVRDVHRVDGAEQRALAEGRAAAHLEARQTRDEAVSTIVQAGGLLRQPGMGEALVDGEALLGVDDEHRVDEVD